MKINQIIREKRKELLLTQEQIAEYLGVSTPAVNKWEKGNTYPDITLLPALARLLKTDLNTLMSFSEDLTDLEIENFVNEVDKIVQEQNYKTAFQMAIDKIHEYPTCEALLYSVTLYLEGAQLLYHVSECQYYKETLEKFYKRMAVSENPEIRNTAIGMLISYNRNRGDYSKAEELINSIPSSGIDQEEQFAILYMSQEKYEAAKKIWEHRVMKGVTEIQTALMNLLEIALKENRIDDAGFFADMYKSVSEQFDFPKWMSYNAHLALSMEKQEKENCLAILKKMLSAMKDAWDPKNSRLYQNASGRGATSLSSKLSDTLRADLISKEEFAFIRENAEFDRLIAETNDSR